MRLKNKKTGQTGYYLHTHRDYKNGHIKVAVLEDGVPFSEFKPYEPIYDYDSLAELNEEWEDYEEPKVGYIIDSAEEDCICNAKFGVDLGDIERAKELGIWFETKEEAEKAVEKLKAWKRLKSCGFKFKSWRTADMGADKYYFVIIAESNGAGKGDLDLLFGGEK